MSSKQKLAKTVLTTKGIVKVCPSCNEIVESGGQLQTKCKCGQLLSWLCVNNNSNISN